MKKHDPIELSQFPGSPPAEELRIGVARLRFAPALEEAFRRLHLDRAHVRARAWSLVTAFFITFFTINQVRTEGPLHPISLLHYVILPAALVAAWLPWSRFYLSHYLPIVRITMPVLAVLSAPFTAQAAAEGKIEVVLMMALQIVGTFQFTGLLYRMALITSIALVAGFAAGTAIWGIPPDVATKYIAIMCLATFLGAVGSRGEEILARTLYLEGQLLNELLERDPLTGLKNRRSFDDHLQRIWMQALRDGRAVAVLMVDVDDFKLFNDTYGHQAGDETLRRVGAVLRDFGRRPLDTAARYGGEEFALIMSDVTVAHAAKVAEQLRAAVAQLGIAHAAARAASVVTLSVGVAVGKPIVGRTPRSLVQLADEALYTAKAAGRNRVIVKGPDEYSDMDSGVFSAPAGHKLQG